MAYKYATTTGIHKFQKKLYGDKNSLFATTDHTNIEVKIINGILHAKKSSSSSHPTTIPLLGGITLSTTCYENSTEQAYYYIEETH